MRILHVATRHRLGGAERHLIDLAGAELRRGHEVHVAAGADGFVDSLPEGTVVHVLDELVRPIAPWSDARAVRTLRRLVGRHDVDVVHTHQSKAGILGRWAARGRASVIVHTVHMSAFGPAYAPLSSASFRAAERRCARFTDRILTVGEELAELYLDAGVGTSGQYGVLRSVIDVDAFTRLRDADERRRRAWRALLGVGPGDRIIASIGALDRRKRHALIMERLAEPLRAGGVSLVLAGDGPERDALPRLAHELGIDGAVHFAGYLADVLPVLGAADVIVHAAQTEGVPQTLLQALAAGVPIVATEVEGLREVPGAPTVILDRDGTGMAEAALHALAHPPAPIDPAALDPWRRRSVEGAIDAHLDFLEARVRTRHARATPTPTPRPAPAAATSERSPRP